MFSSTTRTLPQRLLSFATAAALVLPATYSVAHTANAAPAAATTDGKSVALMRFSGDPAGAELRTSVQTQLKEAGYSVKGVALDAEAAAKKLKCKSDPVGDECLVALGKWLNKGDATAADYIVVGTVQSNGRKTTNIVVFDIAAGKQVRNFKASLGMDLVAELTLPAAIANAVIHHREPPAPATAEEKQALAELDEPKKTAEEIRLEQQSIVDAEAAAKKAAEGQGVVIKEVEIDLKKDFKEFCRTGKREKREKDEPKDLRPKCQRGTTFGYWQPRAWVAMVLTGGALIGTGAFYGAALASRKKYKDAVDDVNALNSGGGNPVTDPNAVDGSYAALAGEVSTAGAQMRSRAVIGDALLGGSVLLGAVLAVIIFQDRRDAKNHLKELKALKIAEGAPVADVGIGPIFSKDTKGIGLHFRF